MLNADEWEALEGQPPAAFKLYCVLRRCMDYASGVTGVMRGISWQGLREELFIEPGPGIEGAGTPSKARVRRLAERLERAGLIAKRDHGPRKLVFFLPLATSDLSASKQPGIDAAYQPEPEPTHPKPLNINGNRGAGGAHPDTGQSEEPGIPPYILDSETRDDAHPREDAERISRALAEAGAPIGPRHPLVQQWARNGVPPADIALAVEKARRYKPAPMTIPPKYLDAVLNDLRTARPMPTTPGASHAPSATFRQTSARPDIGAIHRETYEAIFRNGLAGRVDGCPI